MQSPVYRKISAAYRCKSEQRVMYTVNHLKLYGTYDSFGKIFTKAASQRSKIKVLLLISNVASGETR
jgi:hypothetical protein